MRRRRGAGPRSALIALLEGWARPLASGCEVDYGAVRGAKAAAWQWRLWAQAGWRSRWRHDTVRRGQMAALKCCGSCPARRSMEAWRQLWARADKGKTMTASEWSMRTGEPIPDWLRE